MNNVSAMAFDPLFIGEKWLVAGKRVALATVISTWGSAPRPCGSHFVIDSEGNFEGSVLGGCVEAEVIMAAAEVIKTGEGRLLEFGVTDEVAWRAGLTCGGRISVYVDVLNNPDELRLLNTRRVHRENCLQIIDLIQSKSHFILDPENMSGDYEAIVSEFLSGKPSKMAGCVDGKYFINAYTPPVRLVIVGAVHIAQSLQFSAQRLGWNTVVVDPRSAFATSERFAGAELYPVWPQDIFDDLKLDRHTAVVALSHNSDIDDPALIKALNADCFYIGALGSSRTHGKRMDRLGQAGISAAAISRIHAPVGLNIGAVSPEEISISILAQIIAVLRLRSGQSS